MKILVANLGSTSFKYRLYDLATRPSRCSRAARVERIGSPNAKVIVRVGQGRGRDGRADRRPRRRPCSSASTSSPTRSSACSNDADERGGHRLQGGPRPGPHRRPARRRARARRRWRPTPTSPPRTTRRTSRRCGCSRERFPQLPLVAAFETGFHQTIPEANQRYADPRRVGDRARRPPLGLPRRQPPLHRRPDGRAARPRRTSKVISCHLGGSSSLCAIRDGKSVGEQPGHEPAERACRTTTASATSTSSPCRSSCRETGQTLDRSSTTWPTGRAC